MGEELILKIKDSLDITFDDEDFDRKIIGVIEDGIFVLRSLFGCKESDDINWCEPGLKRMLLKNYCLYALNNVSEKFNDNYRNEIMQVRSEYEVEQWKEANSITT